MDTDCRTKCTVLALLTHPSPAPAQAWSWTCRWQHHVWKQFKNYSPNSAHAKPHALHAGVWRCKTSCFLGERGSHEVTVPRASHHYSSNRKTHLWNTALWLWLLRQHLLARIHWSAVPGGCPRLHVTCPVPEELPHIKRLQLASSLQIWFLYGCLTTKSSPWVKWSSFQLEQVSNTMEWDKRRALKNIQNSLWKSFLEETKPNGNYNHSCPKILCGLLMYIFNFLLQSLGYRSLGIKLLIMTFAGHLLQLTLPAQFSPNNYDKEFVPHCGMLPNYFFLTPKITALFSICDT